MKNVKKIIISLDIETDKSFQDIKNGLIRGIYKGLDTEPNFIAPPKKVKINYLQER